MEPFHCVCRCSKLFLAVSLIFAAHMTAVMTLCTYSITIPMLAWLLGGRWLAANIVLDDMTSSTGVIGGTNHHHHTYVFLCKNTAQIDVNTNWTFFAATNILKSTGLLRSVTTRAQRHSTPVKSVRRRFLRNTEDLQQCRANRFTAIESRETFTNEKTRSHPASKPRLAALRNTTHETINQHYKKEPQHGKTHRFGWQNLLLLG